MEKKIKHKNIYATEGCQQLATKKNCLRCHAVSASYFFFIEFIQHKHNYIQDAAIHQISILNQNTSIRMQDQFTNMLKGNA